MNKSVSVKPASQRVYPQYRYRALLAGIGSDRDIQKLIVSYGFDAPTEATIRGWRVRNSIPSRWLPLLVHRAMREGWVKDATSLLEMPS